MEKVLESEFKGGSELCGMDGGAAFLEVNGFHSVAEVVGINAAFVREAEY